MKITSITTRIEKTVNLANYENVKFALEQTASIDVESGSKEHSKAVKELVVSTTELLEKEINYGLRTLAE